MEEKKEKREYPKVKVSEFKDLVIKGKSYEEISEHYGISKESIKEIIATINNGLPEDQKLEIKRAKIKKYDLIMDENEIPETELNTSEEKSPASFQGIGKVTKDKKSKEITDTKKETEPIKEDKVEDKVEESKSTTEDEIFF